MKVRMLIADSCCVVRKGLRSLLHKRKGIGVVAEAATREEVVRLAIKHDPHVVMLDVALSGSQGIAAAREIRTQKPRTKIIGLASNADEPTLKEMFSAGATGFILKDADGEEILCAVETVLGGGVFIGKSMAQTLAKDIVQSCRKRREHQQLGHLTAREREVYALGERGLVAKEVATALSIKPRTVEAHRRQIRAKLKDAGRMESFAIRPDYVGRLRT